MSGGGSPYRCAQSGLRYLLHVSGGRTSGMLLYRMLEAYGGRLPANVRAVFANTGKEHEKTLVFIREMERRWQVPIAWVEYEYRTGARGGIRDPKNTFRVVDYDTASRRGEPFAMLIRAHKILPNAHKRICTADLKVETAARFARTRLGWWQPRPHSILGIRHDEPRRWTKSPVGGVSHRLPPRRRARLGPRRRAVLVRATLRAADPPGFGELRFVLFEGPLEADAAHHPVPGARRLVDRAGALPAVRHQDRAQAGADALLMRYTYEDLKNTPMMPFDELYEEREASRGRVLFLRGLS